MTTEKIVIIMALFATASSVLTSAIAYYRLYLKKFKKVELQTTNKNKSVEIDEELWSFINTIKNNKATVATSVIVTESELSILTRSLNIL